MILADEQYIFKPATKNKLLILLGIGVVFTILGLIISMSGGHHAEHTASLAAGHEHGGGHEGGDHHGSPVWLKGLYAALWHSNVFFAGIGLVGLCFVAIQYAAQAGWSAPIKRIPLAMAHWIAFSAILMIVLWFLSSHDLFHWTHKGLYEKGGEEFDKALNGKGGFFFWPLEKGSFPFFYMLRMVGFFGVWYIFFTRIKKQMLIEDLDGGNTHWLTSRKLSAMFLVFFGYSSSVAAWDWVMSIDPHWFSTMHGWYVFASWWVTGLAVITWIVVQLKDAGYLKMVNSNHLHDLGKFIFAFSIFWTYIWFSQFMLIYYANIPEETVYFISRMHNAPYSWIFYLNLIMNFVLPFLLLMTRDAKRHGAILSVVCPLVIIGHWFDFYNMITPGVMKGEASFGFLNVGLLLIFAAAFLWVTLTALSKHALVARNHPMMEESLHHHI